MRVDIARRAVAVHRQDGRRLRRDRRFHAGRVQVQRVRVDVDEHRPDAVPQQRMRGGDERVRRGDDFAADAQRLQRRDQRDRRVREQRDVAHAQVLGERVFQLGMEGAAIGQLAAGPDLLQVGQELLQGRQVRLGDEDRRARRVHATSSARVRKG
jgi:hypothetical protein